MSLWMPPPMPPIAHMRPAKTAPPVASRPFQGGFSLTRVQLDPSVEANSWPSLLAIHILPSWTQLTGMLMPAVVGMVPAWVQSMPSVEDQTSATYSGR